MTTRASVLRGDCLDILPTLEANSIDAVVTDPPYHLTTGKKGGSGEASVNLNSPHGRARVTTGFMGQQWDGGDVAFQLETWAEVLRVLKPGGHLLAFGGSRTYHRLACAIEDAGFEIRDQIMWVYGSGFPKSLDVSKAIDKAAGAEREAVGESPHAANRRATEAWEGGEFAEGRRMLTAPATPAAEQWSGYGTALKPAHEPIVMARKPLTGTVAENVQAHGTGALNIDGCRVPTGDEAVTRIGHEATGARLGYDGGIKGGQRIEPSTGGRWPANVAHDGSEEVISRFPLAPGQLAAVGPERGAKVSVNTYGDYGPREHFHPRADTGSAARFFYCAKASREDRDEGLDHLPTQVGGIKNGSGRGYSAGDPYAEVRLRNPHPTVKPTDLMRWLVRLVTPPGGLVLDPFTGSGSTGKAAILEGMRFVGIEQEEEYVQIAEARIAHALRRRLTVEAQGNLFDLEAIA